MLWERLYVCLTRRLPARFFYILFLFAQVSLLLLLLNERVYVYFGKNKDEVRKREQSIETANIE